MKPTTTIFNRLDPRQPTEAEIYAAADAAIAHFEGDLGRARAWAVDEGIRTQAAGDWARNKIAVRLQRAIKERTREHFAKRGL